MPWNFNSTPKIGSEVLTFVYQSPYENIQHTNRSVSNYYLGCSQSRNKFKKGKGRKGSA